MITRYVIEFNSLHEWYFTNEEKELAITTAKELSQSEKNVKLDEILEEMDKNYRVNRIKETPVNFKE